MTRNKYFPKAIKRKTCENFPTQYKYRNDLMRILQVDVLLQQLRNVEKIKFMNWKSPIEKQLILNNAKVGPCAYQHKNDEGFTHGT